MRQCGKVIVTRSLSKSYALAGLRFGFAVARPEIIAQLTKVKDSYNCDALSIAAATAAIADTSWLAKNRSQIIATRCRLEAALATVDTTRARLLEALLHEALNPAESGEMEAAE